MLWQPSRGILQPNQHWRRPQTPAGGGTSVALNGGSFSEGYQSSNTTSYSYTGLTVVAGTNTAIVLLLLWDTPSTFPTGITAVWDTAGGSPTNQALTRFPHIDGSGIGQAGGAEIWGLAGEHGAVATGNKTLSLSWTNNSRAMVCAVALDNVDQTGSTTTFFNGTAANAATTVSVAGTANDMLFCAYANGGSSLGTPTGTSVFSDAVNGNFINGAAGRAAGDAGSIGSSASQISIVGLAVKAA